MRLPVSVPSFIFRLLVGCQSLQPHCSKWYSPVQEKSATGLLQKHNATWSAGADQVNEALHVPGLEAPGLAGLLVHEVDQEGVDLGVR